MNLVLDNVRFSYLNVYAPRAMKGKTGETGKERFSVSLIFNENSDAMKKVQGGIESAAKEKWGERWQGVLKQLTASGRVCLKDGNTRLDRDGEVVPGYEGRWFLNASAPGKDKDGNPLPAPRVFNRFGQKITAETRAAFTDESRGPVSGDYGQAMVQIWAQDDPNPEIGRRINATLLGVALSKFGEPLGRREMTDEDIASEFSFEQAPDLGGMMGE